MSPDPQPGSTDIPSPPLGYVSVLVVAAEATHRVSLELACHFAGVSVLAVSCIAEVERWPAGQVVLTDAAHLTPFWRTVGALEVILLARTEEEARGAELRGATGWLQLPASAAAVAAILRGASARRAAGYALA